MSKSIRKIFVENWGVIISVIVLIILLVLNYNRCYLCNKEGFHIEGFDNDVPDAIDFSKVIVSTTQPQVVPNTVSDVNKAAPPPNNVRLSVTPTSCTIMFNISIDPEVPKPLQFLVVLAQYDNNKKPMGTNSFYLSDEYVINDTQSMNVNSSNNLCTIVNGMPICQYTFNNLKDSDDLGNPFFYKIGISAIYKNSNSVFAQPANIINDYFVLNNNVDTQTQVYQDFLKFKQNQQEANATSYSNKMATADGQYELIKKQLGDYPNNLEINNATIKENTLTDLIDKSMALGKIVVDFKMPTPTTV